MKRTTSTRPGKTRQPPPSFIRREEEPVTPPPHPETQAREITASDTGVREAVREMMWGKG